MFVNIAWEYTHSHEYKACLLMFDVWKVSTWQNFFFVHMLIQVLILQTSLSPFERERFIPPDYLNGERKPLQLQCSHKTYICALYNFWYVCYTYIRRSTVLLYTLHICYFHFQVNDNLKVFLSLVKRAPLNKNVIICFWLFTLHTGKVWNIYMFTKIPFYFSGKLKDFILFCRNAKDV